MKFFLSLIALLFIYNNCCSQQITGSVKDEMQKPISNVNIQLLTIDTNELMTYTKTDEKGFFLLEVKGIALPLKIKATHFLYENQEIQVLNSKEINIFLKSRFTELKEVIIENKAPDIFEKNDTLTYNLNNLLVGTELKLKDIIEKLPGLSIDNNNKIKFKGSIIDNILINGNEFFSGNHQLATENLTAEMIEKIQLLKNYKDLSTIEDFENNGQTALNVILKQSFRDNLKGNFEIEGGYKQRYRVHNNLFKFGSKNNLNVITDINNLNENVFSPLDYLELRKITGKNLLKDKLISGTEISIDNGLPPFVFAQDNINSITTKNNTVNFTRKLSKNKRIEFISILNQTRLTENNTSLQIFSDGISSNIIDQYKSSGQTSYSSNVFKFENKISSTTYFQTNTYLFLSIDDQNQDLNNLIITSQEQTLFINNNNLKSIKTGFNALYKAKVSKNILFEGVLFSDYNFSRTNKNYLSNKNFIGFDFDDNYINQNTNYRLLSSGLKAKTIININKSSLNVKFMSTYDTETLTNNNNINDDFIFKDNFNIANNIFSLLYASELTDKIKYTIGLEFVNTNHKKANSFTKTINFWLPNFNLSYKISRNLSSFVGYSLKQNNPNIYNFISGSLIENQRTAWLQSTLISDEMLTDNYSSGLFYTDIPKSIFANFSLVFSNNRNQIVTNFTNTSLITTQNFQYLNFGNTTNVNTFLSKKFKILPLGINFSSSNSFSNSKAISNENQNDIRFNQNSLAFSLKSYFKDKVNFDLGINYLSNFNNTETDIQIEKTQLQTISPFVIVDGTLFEKKINWKIVSTYHIFKSSFITSNNIMDFGFKINYNTSDKINFYLNAINVLNIRNDNTKNNFSQNDFITRQTIMTTLSGFVNLGISFSF